MDKAYQGVIRRRNSMKDRQNNGQSIPRVFFCPSLIYAFLLPLGIFFPLFCLSFIDLTDKTMDKRYQDVIRRRKSQKERQNNG
jgi:hypothetical protein